MFLNNPKLGSVNLKQELKEREGGRESGYDRGRKEKERENKRKRELEKERRR